MRALATAVPLPVVGAVRLPVLLRLLLAEGVARRRFGAAPVRAVAVATVAVPAACDRADPLAEPVRHCALLVGQ